jgi:hypothetical protein
MHRIFYPLCLVPLLALMAPTGGYPTNPQFQTVKNSGLITTQTLTVNGVSNISQLFSGNTAYFAALNASNGTFSGAVSAASLASSGTLGVTGLATIGTGSFTNVYVSNVANFGNATISGTGTLGYLSVTGSTTLASVSVTGAATAATLTSTGAATLASLGVTGAETVGGTLTVNGGGGATLAGPLYAASVVTSNTATFGASSCNNGASGTAICSGTASAFFSGSASDGALAGQGARTLHIGTNSVDALDIGSTGTTTVNSTLSVTGSSFLHALTVTGNITQAAGYTWGLQSVTGSTQGIVVTPTSNANSSIIVNGLANAYAEQLQGSSTAGQSYGEEIFAGTSSGDYALNVQNASAAQLFAVHGDGGTTVGTTATVDKGAGTLNVQSGIFAGGVVVRPSASIEFTTNGTGVPTLNFCNGCGASPTVARATTGTYALNHNIGAGTSYVATCSPAYVGTVNWNASKTTNQTSVTYYTAAGAAGDTTGVVIDCHFGF